MKIIPMLISGHKSNKAFMNWLKRVPFFHIGAIGIFSAFMFLMIFVTVTAYSRQSGHTGLNMGKIQKMRYDATLEAKNR